MKKNLFYVAALCSALIGLSACGSKTTAPEVALQTSDSSDVTEVIDESVYVDAKSGATGLGVTVKEVTKEEGEKIVYNFLKNSGPYYFSTVENNAPYLRPIGIVTDYDGKIWFHVGKHKNSYQQIQKNPNVSIVSLAKDGQWIRVWGKAVSVDNADVDAEVFKQSPSLKEIYNEKTGYQLGHFYISDGAAEISKGEEVELIRF